MTATPTVRTLSARGAGKADGDGQDVTMEGRMARIPTRLHVTAPPWRSASIVAPS